MSETENVESLLTNFCIEKLQIKSCGWEQRIGDKSRSILDERETPVMQEAQMLLR